MNSRKMLLCGAALAALSGPLPAFSQTSSVDEVVVTARRVEENIQSVPITIQAFSAEGLRERSVTETRDLMQQVPGLYMGGAGSLDNTQYVIRAEGNSGAQERSIPGVASYFADVPLPMGAQSQPGYDIESIQVLKGPQGTLFGRNTVGGAVLVYPAKPNFDGFNGYVQAGLGDYELREGEFGLNLPLVKDKLAARISFHAAVRDGFTKNQTPGAPDGSDLHNWGGRLQLLWKPVESITNLTLYDHYRSSTGNSQAIILNKLTGRPVAPTFVGLGTVGTGDWHQSDTGVGTPGADPRSYVKQYGLTNRTDIDFGGVQLTNIAAYRNSKLNSLVNNDGVDFLLMEPNQGTHIEQYTEELQLKGTALNKRVNWILGGFYLKSKPLFGTFAISYGFTPIFGPAQAAYAFQTDESKAIYGNVNLSIGEILDGLAVHLGYRYTWDDTTLCSAIPNLGEIYNAFPYALHPSQCRDAAGVGSSSALTFAGIAKSSSSAPTWDVGLDWQASQDAFFYLTSRRGYRAGGLNGPTLGGGLASYQSFRPSKVTDVEIGARTDWEIGSWRARLNVSAFRTVTRDVQLGALLISTGNYNVLAATIPAALGPPPPGFATWIPCTVAAPPIGTGSAFDGDCNVGNDPIQTTVSYNGGRRVSKGLEIQATLSPTERLTFSWSGTFYDHKFSASAIPTLLQPYGLLFGITGANDPASTLGTRNTMTGGVRYALPLGDNRGEVVFNSDIYWSDKLATGGGYIQPAFSVVNMRVDWNNIGGAPADVSFYVRNLFDKNYALAAGGFIDLFGTNGTAVIPGDPRMIGVQVRYRFGE